MNKTPELTDQNLMSMKIIAFALLSGPTIFFIVVMAMMSQGETDAASNDSSLPILTAVVIIQTIFFNIIGPFVQKAGHKKMQSSSNPVAMIQKLMIVRYALAEGAALFGIVVLFLGTMNNPNPPAYIWVNLIPFIILYAVIITSFPTRERIEKKIQQLTQEA